MESLPGEIIEKIAFILGDLKVFHLILNTVPALIRRDNIHEKAIQMFSKTLLDENGVQYWYVIGNTRWIMNLRVHNPYNDISWHSTGRLHRDGGHPAVIYNNRNNDCEWWLNGKLIRENNFFWINQIGWVEQDEKEFSSEEEEELDLQHYHEQCAPTKGHPRSEPFFGCINWWEDLEED